MLIYADTSIWNQLFDDVVDPQALTTGLSQNDSQLVLGSNVLHEAARTFQMDTPGAMERGRKLFRYFSVYFRLGLPLLAEPNELIKREADHAKGTSPHIDLFARRGEYEALRKRVKRLSRSGFDAQYPQIIADRRQMVSGIRSGTKEKLLDYPEVKHQLAEIDEASLPDQLNLYMRTQWAQDIMQGALAFVYETERNEALRHQAERILANPEYRVSQAFFRSGIYFVWRSARRGSLRADVPDDAFHTVNASPCDVFLTTERDQANHATLFTLRMRALVYKGQKPLIKWMLSEPFCS